MTTRPGRLVVIEGPNGVGKTTVTEHLTQHLRSNADELARVHATSEPTNTPFGRLLRSSESGLTGRALALAIAADRHHHIDTEIIPHMEISEVVVSDRYVPSSLVLQRIDGLDVDEIWSYNSRCLRPDLVIYLNDHADTIATRLHGRSAQSRLETIGSPATERRLYAEARAFLDTQGWSQRVVDCHDRAPSQIVDIIADLMGTLEG